MTQNRSEVRGKGPEKALTGITGFDLISGGGLPRGRTTFVMGGPGSGKTIFALQTLVNAARLRGEPGIFVAFEENARHIVTNAATFGWDLPALEKDKLFFLDARLSPETAVAGGFDLAGLLLMLEAKAKDMGATNIVFDGIDVLLASLDSSSAERREIHRLHAWLAETDMTGVITGKVEADTTTIVPRYNFLDYLADCVVIFEHRVTDRVSLRSVRISKYRGSSHSANEIPVVIAADGLRVAGQAMSELIHDVPTDRVSAGVERLDTMLGGGYYRGSCVLVSGSPGTAKTTLAGSFVRAACQRGETALFVSFDEAAEAMVRNLQSVSIDLAPYVKSGLLRTYSVRSAAFSSEEHHINIQALMDRHKPKAIVLDPISALAKTGGQVAATATTLRLIDLAKERGITVMCTSLLGDQDGLTEQTPTDISTIADTWIHLSYVIGRGERNRALTVIKSRGTKHSNQVRELVLSDEGVTLADVYYAEGDVLMGAARAEREVQEREEQARQKMAAERRRLELQAAEAEIRARLTSLQNELEVRRAEQAALEAEEARRMEGIDQRLRERLQLRSSDMAQSAPTGRDEVPGASRARNGRPEKGARRKAREAKS